MQVINVNCPACGGAYTGSFGSRFVVCEYCGTRYVLSGEELDALDEGGVDEEEFDDTPMLDFAAEAIEAFLDERNVDASSFVSSPKIIRGLSIDESEEDVLLIHDDTMFKSGKNGFAITTTGFYCREMGEKEVQYTDWEDFANGDEPSLDSSYIRQYERALAYFTDDSDVLENELYDLYLALYDHAQHVL